MKKISIFTVMFLMVFTFMYGEKNPYELKEGIIQMKTTSEINGKKFESTQIYYFDDYGKKIAVRTKSDTNMMGQKVPTDATVISLDKKSLIINHIDKSYMEMFEDDEDDEDAEDGFPDISKMPAPIKKEKILGKNCDVYSLLEEDQDGGKSTTKMWIWKGLILKQEMSYEMPGYSMKNTMIATDIDLKKVSDSYFEAPKGYSKNEKFNEIQKAMQEAMKKHEEEMEKQGYNENQDDEQDESAAELLNGLQNLFGE